MLTTFASCISSVISCCGDRKTSEEACKKGMEHTEKIQEKIQKIFERHVWEKQHLVEFTRDRLNLYGVRAIYFSCKQKKIPLPETEDQVRLLITQRMEQLAKIMFEEIIKCTDGMFAADVLSLKLPPIGPDGKRLELDLDSPIYCQRPNSSLDEKTKTLELYKSLVYRNEENSLYDLEDYHHKANAGLLAEGITSGWPPVADVVHKVVQEKIFEILNQVLNNPSQEAA